MGIEAIRFIGTFVVSVCLSSIVGGGGHVRIKALFAEVVFIVYVVWRELV